ncbi:hypothetical protein X975_01210, partial [Stegodyphus mimosarum]
MTNQLEIGSKMSVNEIASEMFQDSLVTGIPNIITEHDRTKKILKMAYLFICVLGFIFQIVDFFELYLAYPTMMETSFPRNVPIIKPAITFCNKSPVRRSLYCSKYPRRCEKPNNITSFCNSYPHYCLGDSDKMENFTVIPETKVEILKKLTKEDLMNMKHGANHMLTHRYRRILRRKLGN